MSSTILRETERRELAERVKDFVRQSQEDNIYVRNLMDEFGQSPDEKDQIRSLVWAMISRKDLILGDSLTLRPGE